MSDDQKYPSRYETERQIFEKFKSFLEENGLSAMPFTSKVGPALLLQQDERDGVAIELIYGPYGGSMAWRPVDKYPNHNK